MAEKDDNRLDKMENEFRESIDDPKSDYQSFDQPNRMTKEQLEQAIREATHGY